MAVLKNT